MRCNVQKTLYKTTRCISEKFIKIVLALEWDRTLVQLFNDVYAHKHSVFLKCFEKPKRSVKFF